MLLFFLGFLEFFIFLFFLYLAHLMGCVYVCLSAHFFGLFFFFFLRFPNQILVKHPQALTEEVQASCPRWRALNKHGGQNFSYMLHWLRQIKLTFCPGQKRWNCHPITMMCAQPPILFISPHPTTLTPSLPRRPKMGRRT